MRHINYKKLINNKFIQIFFIQYIKTDYKYLKNDIKSYIKEKYSIEECVDNVKIQKHDMIIKRKKN